MRIHRLATFGACLALLLVAWLLWSLRSPHRDRWVEAIHQRGYPASAAELDAWYLAVPPEENPALVYTNAFGLLTNAADPNANFTGTSWLPPIGQGLSADDMQELKQVLAANGPALRLLYSAPASGRSRYPINLKDGPATLLPHLAKYKQAVSLLSAEAFLRATDGDADKATQAFLAAARLAESLGEEPLIISQLVRYAGWKILLSALERALSITPFTNTQLAALQHAVEAADRPQAAARAWAGEQAIHLSIFNDPKMRLEAFQETVRWKGTSFGVFISTGALNLLRVTGLFEKDKAFYCEAMGKQLAVCELPYPDRFAAGQHLATVTNIPNRLFIFSSILLPASGKAYVRDADHTALVRAAATALALERFRLTHTNHLPDNLAQLTPTCCRIVPADPYDGQPLRYKTHGASYVIYSIGSDAQDDGGGAWDSVYLKAPHDVGFMVRH